ncbi:phosphoethanolamine transferase [Alteromonas confluentis]|uniref:Phosphoethanolamine transferase n=1 Tax=Alteromonas confluentis TaxID=1656094 RepID=A0A1E7Z6P8_9ALTE|nr:phosphoethanolamine--lipid A transferase [Alteromonas confluentis]OFC69157.1 phosphoethanolamine transferase [Alteromonas confluentis]
MRIFALLKFRLTPAQTLVSSCLLITLLFNAPFLSTVWQAVSPDSVKDYAFLATVPVLLFSLLILFTTLSGGLIFPRMISALHIIIASLIFYGMTAYGLLFDKSMIQNLIETNSGEAFSYLNASFVLFFCVLGILPVFALCNMEIKTAFSKSIKHILMINGIAIVAIALIAALFYKDYAAVGRNNRNIIKQITPLAFYDAGYKYLRDNYLSPPLPYRILDSHPTLAESNRDLPDTIVMVVGETARADRFSLNGYSKNTNPLLSDEKVVSFTQVTSCGTATAVSVPCMFSRLSRDNYDSRIAHSQDNVLDIIHRAGYSVTWIDNNSTCKGVCSRIKTIPYDPARDERFCDGDYCLDAILLNQLKETLKQNTQKKRLIVLHMIGSHGPTYYRRYPGDFKGFTPDCPRSDIQNCDMTQLSNTYDNTILYTDFVLSHIIEQLKTVENAQLLYLSDHGESLGEKGLYLHGFPYSLAPEEQTHVPMLYWRNGDDMTAKISCAKSLKDRPYSQDNLYDTLLGLTGVVSTTYQPEQDIFASCQ